MAGICKPNVVGLKVEPQYTINGMKASSGSGGTISKCGLFDGLSVDQWNTPEVFYWYDTTYYIDLTIYSNFNIWRSGTTSWSGSNSPLLIYVYQNNTWVDVTSKYVQTLTAIKNNQWEKTLSNMPAGRYKFTGRDGGKYRMDSEWYIESIADYIHFIQKKDGYLASYVNGSYVNASSNDVTVDNFKSQGYDNLKLTKMSDIGQDCRILSLKTNVVK